MTNNKDYDRLMAANVKICNLTKERNQQQAKIEKYEKALKEIVNGDFLSAHPTDIAKQALAEGKDDE